MLGVYRLFAEVVLEGGVGLGRFFEVFEGGDIGLSGMMGLDSLDVVLGFDLIEDGVHVYFVSFVVELGAERVSQKHSCVIISNIKNRSLNSNHKLSKVFIIIFTPSSSPHPSSPPP